MSHPAPTVDWRVGLQGHERCRGECGHCPEVLAALERGAPGPAVDVALWRPPTTVSENRSSPPSSAARASRPNIDAGPGMSAS